jgi:aryl-alcohol dehydrogenase-like predicted oxidoreductase
MEYVALGRTNILVSRIALAAESAQGDSDEQARLIRLGYDAGINYVDMCGTAPLLSNEYGATDLSVLAGAFHGIRKNISLGLCMQAETPVRMKVSLEDALTTLSTDYIDILEIAGLSFLPEAGSNDGIVTLLECLKKDGKIRVAGIAYPFTFAITQLSATSIFETLQFPFTATSGKSDKQVADLCTKREIGCFACNVQSAPQYENVVPLWKIQNEAQLQSLLKE